jgi:hypothetical protein
MMRRHKVVQPLLHPRVMTLLTCPTVRCYDASEQAGSQQHQHVAVQEQPKTGMQCATAFHAGAVKLWAAGKVGPPDL